MPDMTGAPHFWRFETGGELAPAVERFLAGTFMSTRDIYLMREYLRQWILSPLWDANPSLDSEGAQDLAALRTGIDRLTSVNAIRTWIRSALDLGIDPL